MGKANFDLPDDKLAKVIRLSGAKTKREAIILALEDYILKKEVEKKLKKLAQSSGKFDLNWTKKSLKAYRG